MHPHDVAGGGVSIVKPVDPNLRREGLDWPSKAETMVGEVRLENVRRLVEDVIQQQIPGDLIETGVWRGGVTIYMRAVLAAWGDQSRTVWVADSFAGLPEPDPSRFPDDAGDVLYTYQDLVVPLETVQANFQRYGLLDRQVRFLPGWFRDTLPVAPMERLAVLRLDGDLYESTMIALESLYPRLSPGGYVIVDDYGLPTCSAAIRDFRARNGIPAPLHQIDWTGRFWQKGQDEPFVPHR
ncbi:MAG: TylF/MycF/NovP-related O-methyltransferase [Thermomicrobiales bacterium]